MKDSENLITNQRLPDRLMARDTDEYIAHKKKPKKRKYTPQNQ